MPIRPANFLSMTPTTLVTVVTTTCFHRQFRQLHLIIALHSNIYLLSKPLTVPNKCLRQEKTMLILTLSAILIGCCVVRRSRHAEMKRAKTNKMFQSINNAAICNLHQPSILQTCKCIISSATSAIYP